MSGGVTPRQVHELDARTFADAIDDLATLLVDAVGSGASVGFVLPFTQNDAKAWWRSLSADVAAGRIVVVIARDAEGAIGTAQLRLDQMPNGLHRADVAKVLVHRSARRRGVARTLMARLEESARRRGRTLLVLDTITGSDAVKLYERLGWTRAGEIPRYAAMPDGTLAPTTYFFKELR
jgi:GNAT superfamily N-acetyltransferase